MLAEEYKILFLSLMSSSCLQTEIIQKPTLHKHFNVSRPVKILTVFNFDLLSAAVI